MRHAKPRTKTFSIKLPAALSEKVVRIARKRRVPVSVVVRDALEAVGEPSEVSAADLAGDLLGSVDAPPDLSTNPKYMRGYGK